MCRKIICIISFVLVMALASSASADLVNYYDFEEGSGFVVADIISGQDGTITDPNHLEWTGGAPLGPTPLWGYHLHNISGSSPGSSTAEDYITMPNAVGASDALTIAMWIMTPDEVLPEGNPKDWYMRPVWKQEDTGTKGLSWGIRPGDLVNPNGHFRVYVGSIASNVNVTANYVIKYGTWQHLATTFAAGTLKMYVDGQPVASMIGVTNTMNTSSVGFRLGGAITPPLGIANQPFNGYFDEVRIFDTALSDSEILALFQLGCDVVGDLTGDCIVNYDDLKVMAEEWLTIGIKADIYPDGNVDFKDFAILANSWLQ